MSELSSRHDELHETLKQRKKQINHCLDMLRFKREAEQAEQWIAMRDQLLNTEDLGVRVIITCYFHPLCIINIIRTLELHLNYVCYCCCILFSISGLIIVQGISYKVSVQ